MNSSGSRRQGYKVHFSSSALSLSDTHNHLEQDHESSKDIMDAAGASVFNSNLFSRDRTNKLIPSWFPQPHHLWQQANSLMGKFSLAPLEAATYSWVPPYTIILSGEEATLVQWCLIISMLHLQFWPRASIPATDMNVCPLKKSDFCSLTAGSWFAKQRPHDSSVPWSPRYFWLWGLTSFWGEEFTKQQQEITAMAPSDLEDYNSIEKAVPLSDLDCGHSCSTIDWANDTNMITLAALFLADQEFIYQLCLVDPDLMKPVHGDECADHRHPILAPINFQAYLGSHPLAITNKLLLIEDIVFLNGNRETRRWELDDVDERLQWSIALSNYL